MKLNWGSPAPILRVSNVRASLDYYLNVLGFKRDWGEEGMVSVSRGRSTVFLCEYDQSQRGTWMWTGVDDVDALHHELAARGARIRQQPTNFPWAYETQVEDLDGNVLRLGAEPKDGVPFGQFLDAKGVLWDITPPPK